MLLAFSVYTNGVKLLSYEKSKSEDVMQCLHGIRVISTMWVTLWHTFSMYLVLPSQNNVYFAEVNCDIKTESFFNAKMIIFLTVGFEIS